MADSNTIELSTDTFEAQVLNASEPVLVDFWAAWCGPCRAVGPTVDALATDYKGRASVGKVDVDANPELATRYGVSSIPTLLLFVGGEVAAKFVGIRQRDELAAAIDGALVTA